MDFLARHYRVVSLVAVIEAVQSGRRLPQKAVLITFDDAYQDFKDFAWPILLSKRLPATVFVPTAFAAQRNGSFWWDRLYRAFRFSSQTKLSIAPLGLLQFSTSKELLSSLKRFQDYLKTLPYEEAMQMVEETCLRLNAVEDGQRSTMNWKELRKLMKEGVTLGSHTCTHRILTNLSLTQVREEITGSFEDLKRETGTSLPIFSYPNGNTNNQIVEILRQEGVILAFGSKNDTFHL
jgi:peptidoglycan/xylan/chitin deacetylase (PgdA/CDA1 family)